MGREAKCICTWNGKKSSVKALLEPPELIVRGEMRRRIPFAKMQKVKADGEVKTNLSSCRWAAPWRQNGLRHF